MGRSPRPATPVHTTLNLWWSTFLGKGRRRFMGSLALRHYVGSTGVSYSVSGASSTMPRSSVSRKGSTGRRPRVSPGHHRSEHLPAGFGRARGAGPRLWRRSEVGVLRRCAWSPRMPRCSGCSSSSGSRRSSRPTRAWTLPFPHRQRLSCRSSEAERRSRCAPRDEHGGVTARSGPGACFTSRAWTARPSPAAPSGEAF